MNLFKSLGEKLPKLFDRTSFSLKVGPLFFSLGENKNKNGFANSGKDKCDRFH